MNNIDVQNKLIELKKYVPFLEELMKGLKENGSNESEAQLHTMEMLHKLITNSPNKVIKLETLVKCETVILKIYNKKKTNDHNFNKNSETSEPSNCQPKSSIINKSQTAVTMERKESPEAIDSSKRFSLHEKTQKSKESSKDKNYKGFGHVQRSRDPKPARSSESRSLLTNFRGNDNRRTQDRYNQESEKRSNDIGYIREYDNISRNERKSFDERSSRSRDRDYYCRRGNFRKEKKSDYTERRPRNEQYNYSESHERVTRDNKALERPTGREHNTKNEESLYFRRSKTPIDNILTRNQRYAYDSPNQSPNRNRLFVADEFNSKRSKSLSRKNNYLDFNKSLPDFKRDVDMFENRKSFQANSHKLKDSSESIDCRRSFSPDWDDEIEESKEKEKNFQTSLTSNDNSIYNSSFRKDCIRDNWEQNKKQWQQEKRWDDEETEKYGRYSTFELQKQRSPNVGSDGAKDESLMSNDYDPLTFDPAEEDRQRRQKLNDEFGLSARSNNFYNSDDNLSKKDTSKQYEMPYGKLEPPPEFPDFMKKLLDEPEEELPIKENKSNLSVFNRLGNKIEEKLIIRIHNDKAKSVIPTSTVTSSTITDVLKSPPLSANDLSNLRSESGAEETESKVSQQKLTKPTLLDKAPPPPPITFSEFFKQKINEPRESKNLDINFKTSSPKQRSAPTEKNFDLKNSQNTSNFRQHHENNERLAFKYNPHPKRNATFDDIKSTNSKNSDCHHLKESKDCDKNVKSTNKKLNDQVEHEKYIEAKKSSNRKEGNEAKTYGEYLKKQSKEDSKDKVKETDNEAKCKETSRKSEKQKDNFKNSIINEKNENSKTHEKNEDLKVGKKTETLSFNRELSKSISEESAKDPKLDKSKETEFSDPNLAPKVNDSKIENKFRDPRLERASSCLDTLYRNSDYKILNLPTTVSSFKIPKKQQGEEKHSLKANSNKLDKTNTDDKLVSKNLKLNSEQKKLKAKDTAEQKIDVIINRQVDDGSSKSNSKELSKIRSKHKHEPQSIEVIVTNEIKRQKSYSAVKNSNQHSDNVLIKPTRKTSETDNKINVDKVSKVLDPNLRYQSTHCKKNILENKFEYNDEKKLVTKQSNSDKSEPNKLSDAIFVQPNETRKHIKEAKTIKKRRKSMAGEIKNSDMPIDNEISNDKEDILRLDETNKHVKEAKAIKSRRKSIAGDLLIRNLDMPIEDKIPNYKENIVRFDETRKPIKEAKSIKNRRKSIAGDLLNRNLDMPNSNEDIVRLNETRNHVKEPKSIKNRRKSIAGDFLIKNSDIPIDDDITNDKEDEPKVKPIILQKIRYRRKSVFDFVEIGSSTDNSRISIQNIIEGTRRSRKTMCMNENDLASQSAARSITPELSKKKSNIIENVEHKSRSKSKKISLPREKIIDKMESIEKTEMVSDEVVSSTTDEPPTSNHKHDNQNNFLESFLLNMLDPSTNKQNVLGMLSKVLDNKKFEQVKKILEDDDGRQPNTNEILPDSLVPPNVEEKLEDNQVAIPLNNLRTKRSIKKSKTELDRLNDDIRDMFISEGVLNATGRRMCTVLSDKKKQQQTSRVERSQSKERSQPKIKSSILTNFPDIIIKQPKVVLTKLNLSKKAQQISLVTTSKKKKRKKKSNWAHGLIVKAKKKQAPKVDLKDSMESPTLIKSETINRPCPKSKKKILQNNFPEKTEDISEMGLISKLTSDSFDRKQLKNIYPFMHAKSVYSTKCVLCEYSGQNFKGHYTLNHPESEVFISRLPPDTLTDLLQKKNNAPLFCFKKNIFLCYHYRCPFCDMQLSLVRSLWIDHFSIHTGESNYKCSSCLKSISSKKNCSNHFSRVCPNGKIIPRSPLGKNMKLVEGYVCDICNYVQMARANMIKHLEHEHNCNLLKYRGIVLINMEDVMKCNELEGGDEVEKEEQNRSEQDLFFTSNEETNINLDDNNMLETVDNLNQQFSVFPQKRLSSTVSIAEQLSKRFKSSTENTTISTELNKDQSRNSSPIPIVNILDNIENENIDTAELAESPDQVIVPVDKPIPSSRANYLNDIIGEQSKHSEKKKSTIKDCLDQYFRSPKKITSCKKNNKSTIEKNNDGTIIERLNQRLNISPNNISGLNKSTEQLDQSITSDEGNLVIDESIDDEINQQICVEDNSNWDDADDDGWEDIEILPSNLETEIGTTSSEINTSSKTKDKSPSFLETFSYLYSSILPKNAKSGLRKSIKKYEKIDKKRNKKISENSEFSAATESNTNNSPHNDNIINAIPSPANSDPPVSISSEPLKDLNDIQALLDQQDTTLLEMDDRIYDNIEDALALADEFERSGEDPLKNIDYTLDADFEPLENSAITYRVNNFGFKVCTGNIIKFKCLVEKCSFLFTDQEYGLQSHYLLDHVDLTWDGYCYTCEANIFPNDKKIPLLHEFRHMKDFHISKYMQKKSDHNLNESAKPKISIRRLSGDKLSRASPISDNQFQNFSDNYLNVYAKSTQMPGTGTGGPQPIQNLSIRHLLNAPTKAPPPIKNIQAIMTPHNSKNLSTSTDLSFSISNNGTVSCTVIDTNIIEKNKTILRSDEPQYDLNSGNNFLSNDSTLKISSVNSLAKVGNNNNSMPLMISNVASLSNSINTTSAVLMIPNTKKLPFISPSAANKNVSKIVAAPSLRKPAQLSLVSNIGKISSTAPSTGLQISSVTTLAHSENIYTFPNEKSSKIGETVTQQSSVTEVNSIISSLPSSLKVTHIPSAGAQTSFKTISNLTTATTLINGAVATTSLATDKNISNEKGFLKIQNVCSLNVQTDPKPITTGSSVETNAFEIPSNINVKLAVKPWTQPIISKPIDIAKLQLRTISLFALFKCMSNNCFFTTQSVDKMTKHFALHICSRTDTPNDWLECSYCAFHATTTQEYFLHFNEIHNNDVYQCSYCFYRSCNDCNVLIHFDLHHTSVKKKIIYVGIGERKKLSDEIKLLAKNRYKYVHPIQCKECSKSFYNLKNYIQHLTLPHATDPAGSFLCSVCNGIIHKSLFSEHLNQKHSISTYQCIYCLFSALYHETIITHMANFHPSNLLYSCIRVPPKNDVQVTDETIENSTVLANLSVEIDESELRECTFSEEQLNYMSPSLDYKSIMNNIKGTLVLINTTSNNISLDQTYLYNNIEKSKSSISNLDKESRIKKISPHNLKIITVESLSKVQNDIGNHNDTELSTEVNNEIVNLIQQPPMTNPSSIVKIPPAKGELLSQMVSEKPNTINLKNSAAETVSEIIDLDAEDETDRNNQDDLNARILEAAKELVKDTGYDEDLYLCPYCTDNNSRTLFHDENSFETHLSSNHQKSRYICPHCTVICSQIKYLINHLKIHRRHRYFCYFCYYTAAVTHNLNKHIQETHNGVSNLQTVTLAFQNNVEHEFQLVCPKTITHKEVVQFGERLIIKCDRNKSVAKKYFNPSELKLLPQHAIFHQDVVCSECGYKTKVRANMHRHLLQNKCSGEKTEVPISDPVNPVPCLITNEKQFDKMNNFAFSSNVNRKSTQTKNTASLIENSQPNKKTQDEEIRQNKTIEILQEIEPQIPKYVLPNKRFACCAQNCNHLTVSEYMLKYHLQTLHSNEGNFQCPHCPENVIKNAFNFEKFIQHLKLHDAKIFICIDCKFMHYQKNLIERHVNDKHNNQTVTVVAYARSNEISRTRTIQTYLGNSTKPSKTTKQPVKHNDQINNNTMMQWKCSLCNHKTVAVSEMSLHVYEIHGVRFRYACLHCKYGAGQLSAVVEHITDKHPTKKKDVKCAFNRLDDPNPTCLISQDTRPLWSRADPSRVKHIRGILMEEESEINIDVGQEDIAFTPEIDLKKKKNDVPKSHGTLLPATQSLPLKSNKPDEEIIYDMLSKKISSTSKCDILECCSCTFRNISFKAIWKHWQQHHGEKSSYISRPFTFRKYGYLKSDSEECPMPSLSNEDLNKFLKVGMKSVRYQCNRCSKLFNTNDSVVQHKKKEHPKLKMVRCLQFKTQIFFVCNICEYASSSEFRTAAHLLNHYECFKKCNICNMKYDRFLEFIKHLPKHKVTLRDFIEIDANITEFWNKILVLFPNGLFVQRKNLPKSNYLDNNLLKNVVEEIEKSIYNIESQNVNQINLKDSQEKIASDQSESDNELIIDEDFNSEDTDEFIGTNAERKNKRKSRQTDDICMPYKKIKRALISSSSGSDNDAELSLHELSRRLKPPEPYSYYGRKPELSNLSAIFIKTLNDSNESETMTVEYFAQSRPIDIKVVIEKLAFEKIEQMKNCSSVTTTTKINE